MDGDAIVLSSFPYHKTVVIVQSFTLYKTWGIHVLEETHIFKRIALSKVVLKIKDFVF